MSEETREEVVRYKDLQKIKTKEEYENAKKRLDYYMKEYTWLQESQNPMLEIKEEMEKLLPMLNKEKTEAQRYFLRCVNLLNCKSQQIAAGEYEANLKRNITALLVITKEYEQSQKEYKLIDILKGIIRRDKDILEALKINNIFERIMAFGNIPAEKDLSMQDPRYLVDYIGKHYNLVGIQVPDYQNNMALVPVNSNGKITPEQEFVSKMVSEYLENERKGKPHIIKHSNRLARDLALEEIENENLNKKKNRNENEKKDKESNSISRNNEEGEIN